MVIHFSTPNDLVARVAETQAALSLIERPEGTRSDKGTRGRAVARSAPSGGDTMLSIEPEGKED